MIPALPPASSEKLQKVLAEAGLGSRRSLERWIEAGRVNVNGARAKTGMRVRPQDVILVDGRRISRPFPHKDGTGNNARNNPRVRVLRYHKPAGEICSRQDPEKRPTVFDGLPGILQGRWIAVGRLDIGTSGILLFTNAGNLAHRLMHPSSEIEREYAVRVTGDGIRDDDGGTGGTDGTDGTGPVPASLLRALQSEIQLEDGPARFERITPSGGQGRNYWYHVVVKEGRNHEVRRLWEAVGFRVSRLIRIRYGPVQLARELRPGRWEELSREEVLQLMKSAGLAETPGTGSPRRKGRPSRTRARSTGRR